MKRPTFAVRLLSLSLLIVGVLSPKAASAEIDLEKAYRREKAQLEAEKRALTANYDKLVAAQKARRAALRKEIDGMVARLTATRGKSDLARRQIQSAQKQLDTQDDKRSTLASVVEQAEALLERHGIKTERATRASASGGRRPQRSGGPESLAPKAPSGPSAREEDGAGLLKRLYQGANTLLQRQASIRRQAGTFYDHDGKEHKGELLHIGQVATYAKGQGLAGPLVPAGGGHLKLAPLDEAKSKRVAAYLDGNPGATVPVFLYDALDKRRASRVEKTLWQTIQAGGVVVWPILGLGLVALLILLERAFTLQRVHSRATALPDKVSSLVAEKRWKDALEASAERHGAVAHVLRSILRNRHLERPALHDAINEAILDQLPRLQRFLPVLAVIAAVAPLLGLLGTVTGMISTFDVITEHGTGDPKLLSGGISEALVTTELGLIVAIPVLLIHALLSGRVEHIVSDMENNALKVSNQIIRQRQGEDPAVCPADGAPCPHADQRTQEVAQGPGQAPPRATPAGQEA